jgi:hypothetical protein
MRGLSKTEDLIILAPLLFALFLVLMAHLFS